MCKWGTNVLMWLPISAQKSHTGERYEKWCSIDECIAPIIKALNDAGIETQECCCGHDKGCGYIALMDDRVLMLCQDKDHFDVVRNCLEETPGTGEYEWKQNH